MFLLGGSRAELDGKLNLPVLAEQVVLHHHVNPLEPAAFDDAPDNGPDFG